MSHRTQITLEDAQYERLLTESRASGLGLAELIRRAVDRTYGGVDAEEFEAALDRSFGTWGPDTPDGREYVEGIRPAREDRFARW
ncbi:ribbon-helix-helix protein, CopG family [Tsukamurella spumae]|uniref:Antitoxin n=1 Tax=Tsukamurella spumae TaxID=44753 RepID=A0A846WZ92_9ACTN|nr:ribbon-helix-helix protein, CopG family [Tsukamurella spumae]NKY18274.1 antitoxin [Tsukamurella spumae]